MGWCANWPNTASRSTFARCRTSSTPKGSASKKTVIASERDRFDVARRRLQWTNRQSQIDPDRLVFIDETWTKTNMEPLRGWSPRGERLIAKVPHGHWKTMTFIAALRRDGIDAPWLFDGPINGEAFTTYVEKVLFQRSGRARSSSWTISAATRARPFAEQSAPLSQNTLPAQILPRPQPDRTGLCKAQTPATGRRGSNLEAVLAAIGELLGTYAPQECANYFIHAGYE